MMRRVIAWVGLLCLCLPASAQPTQPTQPTQPAQPAQPAPAAPTVSREEWSFLFTSEQVSTKRFKLPDGLTLCPKPGETPSNSASTGEVVIEHELSLNEEEVPLDQSLTVSSSGNCPAGSRREVLIKVARPVLSPKDLDLQKAALDADVGPGRIRLLVPAVKPLPAHLVRSARLSLRLGTTGKTVESEIGTCVGSETECKELVFSASVSSEEAAFQSVSVQALLLRRMPDAAVGSSKQEYFAGTGKSLTAAGLPFSGSPTVGLWQFDELDTGLSPLDGKTIVPYWRVPWIIRQARATDTLRFSLETLPQLLARPGGGEKRLRCVDPAQPNKEGHECAVLTATRLTVTSKADLDRLKPGGLGLSLIARLADQVRVRQRREEPLSGDLVAIRIQPAECSYSFRQLTKATAGFRNVEVLYLVTGAASAMCPLPTKVEVADDSGIKVQRQPRPWNPDVKRKQFREQILSMVFEEVKGEPKTYPLTFKFDNDSAIAPQALAYLQSVAAPAFGDPLRVFIQSPFVGASFAKSSSDSAGAPSSADAPAPSGGSSPEARSKSAQPPKTPPKSGTILIDSIAADRKTFFEFGTGREEGWHLKIRSKGQRPCEPAASAKQPTYKDEMPFYPDLGVDGAYCLVGMQDANKLDLRVLRRGEAGQLALDDSAKEAISQYSSAPSSQPSAGQSSSPPLTIEGGWADVSILLATKPFRLALNLAEHLSFRCVDRELASGEVARDPCQDVEEQGNTYPQLRSSSAVYAYSHDALKTCALRIDIPTIYRDSQEGEKSGWERIQSNLRELDIQRLQISLALAKTDKDTFQTQSLNEPSVLVLDPTRSQAPDWAQVVDLREDWQRSLPARQRLCKTLDLTQGDRVSIEPYARVHFVVEHHDKALYRSDLDFSTPNSRFEVTVRRKPLHGVGASKYCSLSPNMKGELRGKLRRLDWRMYVSIPLSLTLLRGPSSGSASKVSSDVDVPEVAGFGVGAIGIFEPWNYHQNRPLWGGLGPQIHLGMLTTLPYNVMQDTKNLVYPSVSLVAGFGMRLPPSVSPSGTGGGIEAALNAIVWGELMVVSSSPVWRENHLPIPAVLFGLIGQFGAVGN